LSRALYNLLARRRAYVAHDAAGSASVVVIVLVGAQDEDAAHLLAEFARRQVRNSIEDDRAASTRE
jgi:hypothetical protein